MIEQLLPFFYAFLVFAIVAFLFILLGRIFLNAETVYYYEQDQVRKNDAYYIPNLMKILEDRGNGGWKLERIEPLVTTTDYVTLLLIFVKTKTKFRLF
jgi:endo-1,4-beta-D-glucanase Y